MIIGGHSIIYSTNAEADRAFLRDVLELSNVDSGDGWLIFGLPPAELAVHPHNTNDRHEFYLLVDNIQSFVDEMGQKKIVTSPVRSEEWGLLTQLTLPGGGKLGVYEPRHIRPKPVHVKSVKSSSKKKTRSKTVVSKAKKKPRR